jgi:hypothetical protein
MKSTPCGSQFELFRDELRKKETALNQSMLDAFRNCRREQAKEYFELCLKYNELYELTGKAPRLPEEPGAVKLLLDCWFLQDLVRHLTPQADEVVVYVTGNDDGNLRMPNRICPVTLEKQSVVYAKGAARSCSDALIELHERDYKLQLVAHSHPGNGPGATRPSGIDTNYLGRIQSAGSDAVGVIVTRDGYVRFFTVYTELEVSVKGAQNAGDNVFKIPPA